MCSSDLDVAEATHATHGQIVVVVVRVQKVHPRRATPGELECRLIVRVTSQREITLLRVGWVEGEIKVALDASLHPRRVRHVAPRTPSELGWFPHQVGLLDFEQVLNEDVWLPNLLEEDWVKDGDFGFAESVTKEEFGGCRRATRAGGARVRI